MLLADFFHRKGRDDVLCSDSVSAVMVPGDLFVYRDLCSFSSFDRAAYEASHNVVIGPSAFSLLRRGALCTGTGLCVLLLGVGYMIGVLRYSFRFYPGTMIGGMDVSDLSAQQVASEWQSDTDAYSLRILFREGEACLTAKDVSLLVHCDPDPEDLLALQNPFAWPLSFFEEGPAYERCVSIEFDASLARRALDDVFFHCRENHRNIDPSLFIREDGTVLYLDGTASSIRDDEVGYDLILDAVSSLESEIDLRDSAMYQDPYDAVHDEALAKLARRWNSFSDDCFEYDLPTRHVVFYPRDLANGLLYRDGFLLVTRKALFDTVCGWFSVDSSDMDMTERLAFDGYVYELSERLFRDVYRGRAEENLISCLPDPDRVLILDLSRRLVLIEQSGEVAAVFDAQLTDGLSWDEIEPCCASLLSCDTNIMELSNGLQIGSDWLSRGLFVEHFDELRRLIDSHRPAYVMIVRGDRSEAFSNPVYLDSSQLISQQRVLFSSEDFS